MEKKKITQRTFKKFYKDLQEKQASENSLSVNYIIFDNVDFGDEFFHEEIEFYDVEFKNCKFGINGIDNINFEACRFEDQKFNDIWFHKTNFKDCHFFSCDFFGSEFSICKFFRCKFNFCSGKDLNFKQVYIELSDFCDTYFKGKTNLDKLSYFKECRFVNFHFESDRYNTFNTKFKNQYQTLVYDKSDPLSTIDFYYGRKVLNKSEFFRNAEENDFEGYEIQYIAASLNLVI